VHETRQPRIGCGAGDRGRAGDVDALELGRIRRAERVDARDVEADVAARHGGGHAGLVEQVSGDGRRTGRAHGAGGVVGSHERDHLVAAGAQRSDERPAEQARPSGDERARQGWLWSVGCASRLALGATVVSGASGIASAGRSSSTAEARSADEKLTR
jgi:hypothetical protein